MLGTVTSMRVFDQERMTAAAGCLDPPVKNVIAPDLAPKPFPTMHASPPWATTLVTNDAGIQRGPVAGGFEGGVQEAELAPTAACGPQPTVRPMSMAAITQAAGWRMRQAGGRTMASNDNPRFAPFPSICDRFHLGSRQASTTGDSYGI